MTKQEPEAKVSRRRKRSASAGEGRRAASGMRTCALTRSPASRHTMVRLALSPDGTPYIDLLGRAPGRGVYVVAERDAVLTALGAKGVGRVFKGKARPSAPDQAMRLVEDAVRRLDDRLLELIGIGRRAGDLELGMDAVTRLLETAPAGVVVVIASDASDRTRKKVESVAERAGVPRVVSLVHDKATLGARLGRDTLSVVAMRRSKLSARLASEADRRVGLAGSGGTHDDGEVK